ncbi:MAG: hypothetical protein PHF25_00930 [Candidatus Margulisbacteria bacterium]|nr:hypothetical protein [Candidatus Margulisiibacteriota bacterium]
MSHGCIFKNIILCFFLLTFSNSAQITYDYLKDVHLVNKLAGLSYLEQPAVNRVMDHSLTFLQYGSMDGQSKSQFANLTIPGYFFNLGLTVKHDVISGINRTDKSSNGTFFVQDTFNHEKAAAMLTVSQKIPKLPIYYGVNAKAYQQKVLDQTMTGYGFDAGVMIKMGGTIIGATFNDINSTVQEWENGTVDQLPTNISYQLVQQLPFGYVSYVGSDLNDDYVKLGLDFFGVVSIESKMLLTEKLAGAVSCGIDLGIFEIGIRQELSEVAGTNSQFFMTLNL